MSEVNPYSQNTLPDSIPPTESSVRLQLLPPATGIAILSTLHILIELLFIRALLNEERASPQVASIKFIAIAFNSISVIYAVVLLVGAVGMLWRGSYKWATTTCNLALTPFIGPCFVLAIPLGIWGLIVLARPNVREALQCSRPGPSLIPAPNAPSMS